MADNFFGFQTDIPSRINLLGRHTVEEELLTDDVEEEYDALNDETFGQAANDDWEEAHEKLSELIKQNNLAPKSVFNDSLLETDGSQDEIVSKSISQLGLEDDLDDPAIMTISRNCYSLRDSRSAFGSSSPPPPAFLDTEDCGSPKTHSIWSTTPKDSGITSFLQSVGHKPDNYLHNSSLSFDSSSDSVFTSPPKAWRVEDLERDLLSKEPSHQFFGGSWPQVPPIRANINCTNQSPPRLPNVNQHQSKVNIDRMLTREEVERQMQSDSKMCFPPSVQNNYGPPQIMSPMLQQNLMSPIGSPRPSPLNIPNQSSPILPLRPGRNAMLGNNCRMPDPYYFMKTRMNNLINSRMPLRGPPLPNLPPGFNPSNLNINHKMLNYPPRTIAHPLLYKHFQFPVVYHNKYYGNEDMRNTQQGDEYAGLMTQQEKEWLIRIQLSSLKTENPYVEDYYFTTQVARRCRKKYSESANKGAGDAPELILPEKSKKHENKTYVPTQFEGSLGKLQAISVNCPRKVLDITVTKSLEDDEGKVVTNQSLLKYRRLLIDIEKLYTDLLEIEDEERRILAKPDSESGPHRINIDKLTKNIYNVLFNNSQEDNFQHIMTIRKGRSLMMRVFKIFNKEQQLQCLTYLFQHLSLVLKKDQNDHILVQHLDMILNALEELTVLSELLSLGEALQQDTSSEQQSVKKDKCNLASALRNKFGISVVCKMLLKAEELYCDMDLFASDIQTRWAKIVQNIVDCICLLPTSSIASPEISCENLLTHIQRFSVNCENLDVLKERLTMLGNVSQNGITNEAA